MTLRQRIGRLTWTLGGLAALAAAFGAAVKWH
jgi:hypothetical protein